ncbi:unnamed protein product [Rhizophagus irregularis]|uniref:Uncharacterized protein n=1 Tax=Rhizophagus irregularis TaxID=588596 RepID=A0A2N1MYF2_9GLOM|nr:hypothetical protein RhiirC2_852719 [Rhizophagus irregularis]CAB4377572.1 unnamed protein product [Rhizophagus irregularis]CAB4389989.1 unnamed protein product [Rhizophagus irregularis]
MQSDDFCDLFEERYLSDNGDNDVPINLNLKISGTKLQININVAESCHANENRDGKSLLLEAAILEAKKYDTCQLKINMVLESSWVVDSKQYVDLVEPSALKKKINRRTSTSLIVNDDLERKTNDFFEREKIRTRRERAET